MKRPATAAALLSVLVLTAQAHAFQCENGQAHVQLTYLSPASNSHSQFYEVQILGKSSLEFDDIPKVQDADKLTMHLITGVMKPAVLYYFSKVDQPKCVQFSAGGIIDGAMAMHSPARSIDRGIPTICFSDARGFSGRITLELSTTEKHDPVKPTLQDVQVFVRGIGKDGKDLTLFDTRTPCKE